MIFIRRSSGSPMVVRVFRVDRRRRRRTARRMAAAGWPAHMIARSLRLSRDRVLAILSANDLSDLNALIAAAGGPRP